MEKIHCSTCNQPTFHQTTNAYGIQIHPEGVKCLTCGNFAGEPDNVIKLPQKAQFKLVNGEVAE